MHSTVLLLDELLDDEATDRVACVPLASVRLDYDTSVDLRSVTLFMLRAVVGVDGVRYVTTDEEGPCDRLSEGRWGR